MKFRHALGFILAVAACTSSQSNPPTSKAIVATDVSAMLEGDVGKLVGLTRDDFAGQSSVPLAIEGCECDGPTMLFGKPVVDYQAAKSVVDSRSACRVRFIVVESVAGKVRVELRKEGRNGMVAEAWVERRNGTWQVAEVLGTAIGT